MSKHYQKWDEKSDEQLRDLFIVQGLSATLVGRKMGLSRNSILSRANRIGAVKGKQRPAQFVRPGPSHKVIGEGWTGELDGQLILYCSQGLSWRKIGAKLGVSDSTALNRARRLGIKKESAVLRPSPPKRQCIEGLRLCKSDCFTKHKPTRKTEGEIGVADLKKNMCRWPVGEVGSDDFSFCGDGCIRGSSYCADHTVKSRMVI